MSTGDIIVIAAIAVLIVIAVTIMIHNKRSGKRACGCDIAVCSGDCSSCSSQCNKKTDKTA